MPFTPMRGSRNLDEEFRNKILSDRRKNLSEIPRKELNFLAKSLGIPHYRCRSTEDLVITVVDAL